MAIGSNANTAPGKAIYQLIVEAANRAGDDRRIEVRQAFFRPVVIEEGGRSHPAFSREISAFGIGLIHEVDLRPGEVEISIASDQGYSIRVRTRILWCDLCGEGWYISGGHFVGIAAIGR